MKALNFFQEIGIFNKTRKIFNKIIRIFKLFISCIKQENFHSSMIKWQEELFIMPAPPYVKRRMLLRTLLENSTIIETGTHTGDTTEVLTRLSDKAMTIEPDQVLYTNALDRFKSNKKVQVFNGTSESALPKILENVTGDISFWLDGHYSGDGTFLGETETPIIFELATIQARLINLGRVCILIDDVRLFINNQISDRDYPTLNYLVRWSEINGFKWYIEHDIFVAKNY